MKFFNLASVALAACTSFVAAIDSTTVIDNIKALNKLSADTNQYVGGISVLNFPLQAPPVPDKVIQIVRVFGDDIRTILAGPSTPYPDAEAKAIVVVLTDFVKVHQAILNTLIRKHGFITLLPLVGPHVADALVALERVVDSFAFAVTHLIPTQKTQATAQFDALSITLTSCMQTYSPSNSVVNV